MSVVVTRMQDFASEKLGVIRCVGTHTAGHSDLPPHPQHGLWVGTGRKRPGVWTQTLVPLNFSAVVAPLVATCKHMRIAH